NPEGKGELTMGNLLVNSLRMRPDRILVGEVRRKAESETLFEAIHTGHSVYATIHANSAQETVDRLTTPPIDVPPILIPAISLIVVQLRNRRTGARRTFQIAEVLPDASINVLMQYDPRKDVLVEKSKSKAFLETLRLFTGYSATDVEKDLQEKIKVLEYLVKQKISSVNDVGHIVAMYYTDKKQLFSCIKNNTCIRRS
ncbi:type II secretion protein, partial [Candidatus Woesearchaeota archaeon CG11_big_fil_rev_8_21_14_0_20_57_5]